MAAPLHTDPPALGLELLSRLSARCVLYLFMEHTIPSSTNWSCNNSDSISSLKHSVAPLGPAAAPLPGTWMVDWQRWKGLQQSQQL